MTRHLAVIGREAGPALYVVTARDAHERSGCVVGFVTQCSIYPERLLVCLSRVNHTFEVALRASALGVHLLTDADDDLARRFGEESGDDVDKFAGIVTTTAECGAPILPGPLTWVAGMIRDVHPFGDHVGFVVDPSESGGRGTEPPLRTGTIDLDPGHPASEILGRHEGHASS